MSNPLPGRHIWMLVSIPLLLASCTSDPSATQDPVTVDAASDDLAVDLPIARDTQALDTGSDLADIDHDTFDDARDGDDVVVDAFDADVVCPDPPTFDYSCEPGADDTCPEGFCIFGQCIAPVVDADRWAHCGDGRCGPCEDAASCPADCAEWPERTGEIEYDNDTTITVMVPGFRNVQGDDFETMVYGQPRSGGDLVDYIRRYQPGIPSGVDSPSAPNQALGVEYYGAVPAGYMTADEIAEIESYSYENEQALHRYALIVATFLAHRLAETGATHVNVACHSMGCHISRYLIEHDLRGLATSGRIARWMTSSGVIGGARLARLYDNPLVRDVGAQIGLNTADFIHMHPDFVADHSAIWDHRPHEANSPHFAGVLIHHSVGTDPRVVDAAGIRLLDLSNPDDEPNDGIVHTSDEYFHAQDERVRPVALSGRAVAPTVSYQILDHFGVSESAGSGALATAALFHARKVYLTLRSVTLLDDLERDDLLDFDHQGDPPAELVVESTVRYDPFLSDTFGDVVVIHQQTLEDRSLDLRSLYQNVETDLDYRIFEGPVFDQMDRLTVTIDVLEVDEYNRFDLHEWVFDAEDRLIQFSGEVSLEDQEIALSNDRIEATLEVRIEQFY